MSSGFLTAKAFQFNKMFQENIILEPVSSALGGRGCVITRIIQKPRELGLSLTATQGCQEQVGGFGAPLKEREWTVREGTEPGVFHDRSYRKVPGPSHEQRLKKALRR